MSRGVRWAIYAGLAIVALVVLNLLVFDRQNWAMWTLSVSLAVVLSAGLFGAMRTTNKQ